MGTQTRRRSLPRQRPIDGSGVVLDDSSTWDPDAHELLELWDHQAQWDLRQHPPLYEAFAAAYRGEAPHLMKIAGTNLAAIHIARNGLRGAKISRFRCKRRARHATR